MAQNPLDDDRRDAGGHQLRGVAVPAGKGELEFRYEPASVIISGGLQPGETIVTAGVQSLHPGQKVRLLGSSGS